VQEQGIYAWKYGTDLTCAGAIEKLEVATASNTDAPRDARSNGNHAWLVLPHFITPVAPVPGLKVKSVRRPTPFLQVPMAPWREYICHFDKYPGGRVVHIRLHDVARTQRQRLGLVF
jgi:hypothetical protein